ERLRPQEACVEGELSGLLRPQGLKSVVVGIGGMLFDVNRLRPIHVDRLTSYVHRSVRMVVGLPVLAGSRTAHVNLRAVRILTAHVLRISSDASSPRIRREESTQRGLVLVNQVVSAEVA